MTEAPERLGTHIGQAMEAITGGDKIVTGRQRPCVAMAELLAWFDPAKHRHGLGFDRDPVGTETP
jgi:hypothetical protein